VFGLVTAPPTNNPCQLGAVHTCGPYRLDRLDRLHGKPVNTGVLAHSGTKLAEQAFVFECLSPGEKSPGLIIAIPLRSCRSRPWFGGEEACCD
jgi:hypothetical protein